MTLQIVIFDVTYLNIQTLFCLHFAISRILGVIVTKICVYIIYIWNILLNLVDNIVQYT